MEAEKEDRRKRMRSIIKKVDETAKQREAKQKSIQRQREQLRRRRANGGIVAQTSKPGLGPAATVVQTAEHTLRGSGGTEVKLLDSRETQKPVRLSETDSIFDQAVVEQDT